MNHTHEDSSLSDEGRGREIDRQRLAALIGRLLARHWLRSRRKRTDDRVDDRILDLIQRPESKPR